MSGGVAGREAVFLARELQWLVDFESHRLMRKVPNSKVTVRWFSNQP